MQTEANGRRAHAAHSLSCWNGIILLIQDCSHTAARNCNKMVSLIMEEEMEKLFFFFLVILHDCNHLKRNIMWRKM